MLELSAKDHAYTNRTLTEHKSRVLALRFWDHYQTLKMRISSFIQLAVALIFADIALANPLPRKDTDILNYCWFDDQKAE